MSTGQESQPGKSGNGRIATRDLVTIGQRWERTARRREDRHVVVIAQVHRRDRVVDAYRVQVDGPVTPGGPQRIKFTDLRAKYRLLDQEQK